MNNLAFATSVERIRKDQLGSKMKFYCFKNVNSIYEYPVRMMMQKDFPLLNELNEFILYANDGGLTNKWLKGTRYGLVLERTPTFVYSEINQETFIFPYLLCGSLFLIASFVVCFEKNVHKNVRNGSSFRFWYYFEMLIDPNRYFLLKDLSYEMIKN